MIYGYARVSTEGQDLADQLERLKAAGCRRIFHEKRSGKNADRPELQSMLRSLGAGDTVLATVTDRIARDPLDMLTILRTVKAAGAGLRLLDEPFIDTTSEMSDLILYVVGWAAQWQRRNILRNTAIGRERAMARGVKFGRKPKLGDEQRAAVIDRLRAGESLHDLAEAFGVSESTIARARERCG
ncbi:recombinase family protein [Mesorhizobium sp. M2D.F.Ca.ET.223.01.1.1]|uniref:recombinase family protein n=1 Tax=unclassified Mesorhizobium TaxID=325217 RepID=UPI000FCB0315|nr:MULTISPECIES: recombinase family protein [unclassified Mesorhizobium]TGP89336.1 recombinase family protein [bacterium M00.F.Ca.ET.221.01.1.1]TGP94709.1 recombinase family protein [bacterium M00.F.Ca.ET.222.01.1.1]RVD58877.1 recombinase family protein [Mesorhizobium sp. M2D.F.Ca.ET.140.01.1.1]TGP27906.1 recombinase family protein [Mesorhizobium sp. M2D.F.Ca.ET.232.01.1.1]TGP75877.1 recombinase family protein [Mesorhizobium sp. M2D.F.Ca.ET.224.01.1.1]